MVTCEYMGMRPIDLLERFEEAAKHYLPNTLRLLFIAEAPPAFKVNRLFYFTGLRDGDTLFLETMKVLYPSAVGYHEGAFRPGYSAKQMRLGKQELLRKFQNDGYQLIDAYEEPMPDGANAATKTVLMRSTLPALQSKLRRLVGKRSVPIILIGGITYSVCAEALRADGHRVVNDTMIHHPARGGLTLFRAKLSEVLTDITG
ncbi:MAG: hypothetical protein QOH35_3 [Acidobacteriaceae bacterium]|nr:hypothetical protein [Acidobacteriaceae bacterium]